MNKIICTAVFVATPALLLATPANADHGAAGTGPQTAGPIVGTSARTLAKGKAAFSLDVAVAEPDNRSDATLASLAGLHIHAHDQASGQVYTLGAAYGVTDDLSVSASLPYVRRVSIREGEHSHAAGTAINSVVAPRDSAGIGDAALVAKWRFTGENHLGWEAALIAGIKLPTGATHEIDDEGERFETEHQPGTGSWDSLLGFALTRPLPWGSVNASSVYQFSNRGSQRTTLGDRAQASIGVAHRIGRGKLDYHSEDQHEHTGHDLSHHHASPHRPTLDASLELNAEWEGREREAGVLDRYSGGKALFLSPGLRMTTSAWSLTLSGSAPLTQDIRLSHSDTSYRIRIGVGRAL